MDIMAIGAIIFLVAVAAMLIWQQRQPCPDDDPYCHGYD